MGSGGGAARAPIPLCLESHIQMVPPLTHPMSPIPDLQPLRIVTAARHGPQPEWQPPGMQSRLGMALG